MVACVASLFETTLTTGLSTLQAVGDESLNIQIPLQFMPDVGFASRQGCGASLLPRLLCLLLSSASDISHRDSHTYSCHAFLSFLYLGFASFCHAGTVILHFGGWH